MAVCVVLVLDAGSTAERRNREARDVTGGEHVGAAIDTAILVDEDPVVHGEARSRGKVGVGRDPKAGDDGICFESLTGAGDDPEDVAVGIDRADRLARDDLDSVPPVVVRHERGQFSRKIRAQIPGSGKTIVTSCPFIASAAAISEPIKPPPITTTRAPSAARSRTRR